MRFPYLIPVCAALLGTSALPSAAQTMSAAEFDAYTRGKTLFYAQNGTAYGAERYLDGRQVIWSFLDGECKYGTWYETSGQICFVYEDRIEPQCWTFREGPGGLIARFEDNPTATELYEAQDTGDEMMCKGPDVGV
ncbi:hypothetical protein [Chachezhania antarctica]|uniref:hypothetical protein n=1 Tax=Chachezhania antarctica TaxID=2340860 RepID=UPI000EB51449|tara:strand:- start:13438 stop:13845 length:408 start_codon:yes stop_codon:yes gene_type:complete